MTDQELIPAEEAAPQTTLPVVAPVMEMIERLVLNPEADIDKLEKMVELQERMLDRDQKAEFNRAMVKAQSEMPVIVATSDNKQTKSKYAKLDAINKKIVPIYTDNGFAVSFDTADSPLENHIRIVAEVVHSGGWEKHPHYDLPIDDAGMGGTKNKTPMHGRSSTVKYGQRYLLCMIFNVSTGTDDDNDGNGEPTEYITDEQAANVLALLDETGTDLGRYLKHIKLDSLALIAAEHYDKVISGLEKSRK